MYSNACNVIDNNNRMRKSDLAEDKYGVTQSGYFILATKLFSSFCPVGSVQLGSYFEELQSNETELYS